jgi:hypothetical protein
MAHFLQGLIEYGTFKDYVDVADLVRFLRVRGASEFKTVKTALPILRELIGTDHRIRLVLNGSHYRLRGVKFTEAVLSPKNALLPISDTSSRHDAGNASRLPQAVPVDTADKGC